MVNYSKFYEDIYPQQYDKIHNVFNADYKDFKCNIDLNGNNSQILYESLLSSVNISELDRKLLECRYDDSSSSTLRELSRKFRLSDSRIQQRLKAVERKLKHHKNVVNCLQNLDKLGE